MASGQTTVRVLSSTAECELVAAVEALTMAKSLEAVLRQMDGDLEGIGYLQSDGRGLQLPGGRGIFEGPSSVYP